MDAGTALDQTGCGEGGCLEKRCCLIRRTNTGFLKVIHCQKTCVVRWRESAAYGWWKSKICLSVQSAPTLARQAGSGERSHPGSPAAAGLWLGR